MKYKKLAIKCKNSKELIALQKHLFSYKYSWYHNYIKNKQLKTFNSITYVIIENDDRLKISFSSHGVGSYGCKIIDYIAFQRLEKLQKLKNL